MLRSVSDLRVRGLAAWWAGTALALVAAVVAVRAVDPAVFGTTWDAAVEAPLAIVPVLGLYASAFVLRAWVWTRLVPELRFGIAWAAVHVSLGANHVLPLRLGEVFRVTTAVRRGGVPLGSATSSTLVLRAADIVAVAGLAALLGPRLVDDLLGGLAWVPLAAAAAVGVAGFLWLRRTATSQGVRAPRLWGLAAGGAIAGWLLESAVIWQAAAWAGIELSAQDAVLVTAVTIGAQVFAVAPAGLGTYEAAATAAFVALGADATAGLAAAVAAHALKTVYSLIAGGVALFVPSPGAFGRLRLERMSERVPAPPPDGPVVLFLPAHDEVESVAAVVRRIPERVCGREVVALVVDDGSTDGTGDAARAGGAAVVTLPHNLGLGAAVRRGLAEGVARGAAAIAFCDADGEYAPEELATVVEPILSAKADYVVGSRFAGRIDRMLPHRRLGNVVLTKLLSFVARRKISDGQSGYRALSARAAAGAEIVHDYNYAQVLTLDLLGKGFRYIEVPISYRFRTTGKTFVKLGRYLRNVVPAVHRELNSVNPPPRARERTPAPRASAVR